MDTISWHFDHVRYAGFAAMNLKGLLHLPSHFGTSSIPWSWRKAHANAWCEESGLGLKPISFDAAKDDDFVPSDHEATEKYH